MAVEFSEPAFLNDIPYWKGLGRTWCWVRSARFAEVLHDSIFVLQLRRLELVVGRTNDPPMRKSVRVINMNYM